jgi:hypothetical protein
MNSKRTLMTVLVGLAMLAATPIAASAKDHGRRFVRTNVRASRPFVAPVRNFGPVVVNKHQFRNSPVWTPAPVVVTRHEWKGNGWKGNGWKKNEWKGRGWGDADDDDDDYQGYGYGNPGYVAAPVYAAPAYQVAAPYYGGGYAGVNGCRKAQSIVTNYYKDRNTGHPAAAADMLRKNQWAFRSGCAGGAPYNGGLLGGLGALGGYGGAPAYPNYGGYNGGYNSGYYGQPYGGTSMLAPLIHQFIP